MEFDIETLLPGYERADEAKSFLKELGVYFCDDLQWLDEKDLVPFFSLVKARRLLAQARRKG